MSQKKGKATGPDGMSLADFALMAGAHISRLHAELTAGTYRPGGVRRFPIPKRKSGGQRVLSIPNLIDRIAQRAVAIPLAVALEPEFNDTSYGYREGKSVQQAVARVATLRRAGYTFVVDADIRAFFDEVRHDILLQKLVSLGFGEDFLAFLRHTLASFSDDGIGLAQGSPLSPVLANLYLDALDDTFEDGPVRLVRFADDFVLLTKTKPGADQALDKARALLAEHGLSLHPTKTRIVPFEQAFSFLGHLFVRSLSMREADAEAVPGPHLAAHSVSTPEMRNADYQAEEKVAAELLNREPAEPEEQVAPRRAKEIIIDGPVRLIRKRKLVEEPDDTLAELSGDRDPSEFARGLAPLYVLEPGRRLIADHQAFEIREGDRGLLKLHVSAVGRIELGPETEAEDDALRLAASNRIPVTFLNGHFEPQALLLPVGAGRHTLHLAQAQAMLQPERGVAIAKGFVEGRIRNEHALLSRLNRRRKNDKIKDVCEALKREWRRCDGADSVAEAMQIESQAAIRYWPALGLCFEHGFGLSVRRETPVENPVNAVLNFTAHLLLRDMRAAALRAGLHLGFGFLHAAADDKEPCVYDLVEAFRAPLAEGLCVYLFNNRYLREADFVQRDDDVRIFPSGSRKVVAAYEQWLQRPVKNPRTGAMTSWRGLLLHEARALATAIESGETFEPYRLDH